MTTTAKIIEAATLMYKLGQIDSEGEELERAGREFDAALAQLEPADQAVMFMVGKLLEGKTFSVTAASPEEIRKYRNTSPWRNRSAQPSRTTKATHGRRRSTACAERIA
jgi:hypothetical protein